MSVSLCPEKATVRSARPPITFFSQFTLRRCCVWKVGMTPANKTDISQPGSSSSMTKRSCKDITCPNGVDPCTPKNTLLRGE